MRYTSTIPRPLWLLGWPLWLGLVLAVLVLEVHAQSGAEAFHAFHVDDFGIDCVDCHITPDDPAPGYELTFSEQPYHPVCEDCHEEAFESTEISGPICFTCHINTDFEVAPFPSGPSSLVSFSHVKHVDPQGRVSSATGIRQDCVFCHQSQTDQTVPALGGHNICGSCHAAATPTQPVLSADESGACLGCHILSKIDRYMAEKRARSDGTYSAVHLQQPAIQLVSAHTQPQRIAARVSPHAPASPRKRSARDPAYWDIVPFDHGRHVQTRDGAAIDCATCHQPILDSTETGGALQLPTMDQCTACHENATWVRPAYLAKNCQVCHQTLGPGQRPLAQTSISPSLVHNESFRRRHAEAARAPNNKCRSCHVNTANAEQDGCSDCHSTMRPRNHASGRFWEQSHGRLAAMDRKQCVNCHTSDSCNRCHNIPPRSHFPLASFRSGGHRNLAAINMRSCFTCHTFERTCMDCHERNLRR